MKRAPSPARRARTLLAVGLVSLASVAASVGGPPRTPEEHRRGGVQTFRSLPDWTPVQSRTELAAYLAAQQAPSAFPFFSHVAQFWQSYGAISQATPSSTFDLGHHLRAVGTGVAHGFEFGLKACYEATVGHLAEASANGPTAEEQLAARVALDYADFIRGRRPQDYDHLARLNELWQAAPLWGDNVLRKWERRFALSTEYGAKAAWGWVMHQVDGSEPAAPPATALLLNRWPASGAELPALKKVRDLGGGVLATLPRRATFTDYAVPLAQQGVRFEEVAGNQGPILVSVLMPPEAAPVIEARLLLTQPVLTRPDIERRWLAVPVPELADALCAWAARPELQVDHIYDF
ncbi:MAG TPA: hypothetical protein VFY73_16375 [Ideonella sp.]|uniref:hypothetical protein n=1 Tax=Ideonella sp. TaxID=1929293 RepID=UPI002E3070AB|nr:hypothetical protein [Ideonella sp.]HEX5685598.1 hypothetical protein [Ideonella sp.]